MQDSYVKSKEAVDKGLVAIILDLDGFKYYYLQNKYGCLCIGEGNLKEGLKDYIENEHHSCQIDALQEDFLSTDKFLGTTTVTELLLEHGAQL